MNWEKSWPILFLLIVMGTGGSWGLASDDVGKTVPVKPVVTQLSPQEQALFDAVKAGDKEKVKKLIADGVNVNCRPAPGWENPLFAAIKMGHPDIVQLLIDAGADIHALLNYRWQKYHLFLYELEPPISPLEFAFSKERISIKILDSLFNAGANINERFGKREVVSWDIKAHSKERLGRLRDNRIDGYTPLLVALDRNRIVLLGGTPQSNEDVAIYLIDRGADLTVTSRWGKTPLLLAMQSGYRKATQILLDKGVLDLMTDKQRKAIFAEAVALGDKKMMKRVMAYSVSPNSTIKGEGGSALDIAIKHSNWESLEFLLKLGVSPAPENFSDCHAKPPLVQLTESLANGAPYPKLRSAVQMLIDNGADINQSDCHGFYPLAITIGRVKTSEEACLLTLQMLADFGVDMNRFQDKGASPLAVAIRERPERVVEFLLTHGADPIHSIRDVDGSMTTPEALAEKLGLVDIAQLLTTYQMKDKGDL